MNHYLAMVAFIAGVAGTMIGLILFGLVLR